MDRHELLQQEFLEVCAGGDYDHAQRLLRAGGIDVTFQHRMNGWSALHWAACRGHENICVLLLEYGFQREALTSSGKTSYDICSESNAVLRAILRPEDYDHMELHTALVGPDTTGSSPFSPSYLKNPTFPYTKKTNYDMEPVSPTKGAFYSYGRRDSVTKTRFILVQTSAADGKEAYKRITVPGGSTLQHVMKLVENALRKGPIKELLILPHRILLDDDSQIGTLENSQKIAVCFAPPILEEDDTQTDRSEGAEEQRNGETTSPPSEEAVVNYPNNVSADEHIMAEPVIEASQQVQMNEHVAVDAHIVRRDPNETTNQVFHTIAELRAGPVAEFRAAANRAIMLADIDRQRLASFNDELDREARNNPNNRWVDWLLRENDPQNAFTLVCAVALGVSLGALLLKHAMR